MVHENALDLINDYSFYPIFLFYWGPDDPLAYPRASY